MARKYYVQLIDDLSGEEAAETLQFTLDGAGYEIDLTADHASELRGALAEYVAKGRRLSGTATGQSGLPAPVGREETRMMREWAHANGYNPSPRGRIRQDIQQAYAAAHA